MGDFFPRDTWPFWGCCFCVTPLMIYTLNAPRLAKNEFYSRSPPLTRDISASSSQNSSLVSRKGAPRRRQPPPGFRIQKNCSSSSQTPSESLSLSLLFLLFSLLSERGKRGGEEEETGKLETTRPHQLLKEGEHHLLFAVGDEIRTRD